MAWALDTSLEVICLTVGSVCKLHSPFCGTFSPPWPFFKGQRGWVTACLICSLVLSYNLDVESWHEKQHSCTSPTTTGSLLTTTQFVENKLVQDKDFLRSETLTEQIIYTSLMITLHCIHQANQWALGILQFPWKRYLSDNIKITRVASFFQIHFLNFWPSNVLKLLFFFLPWTDSCKFRISAIHSVVILHREETWGEER